MFVSPPTCQMRKTKSASANSTRPAAKSSPTRPGAFINNNIPEEYLRRIATPPQRDGGRRVDARRSPLVAMSKEKV